MIHKLTVRVVPRSKKQSCGYDRAGRITIHVRSVPEKGAANEELLAYVADRLGIARSHVRLLSGATSRIKRIEISGNVSEDELYRKLGLESGLQIKIGLFD